MKFKMSHWRAWVRNQYQVYHPTIWLLTAGRLFNSIIQFMSAPFLIIYLHSKGIDLAIIGLISMTGPIGSTLGNLIGGQISDRFGRKQLMVLGLAASGLATAGFSVASATWHFAVLMILQGFFGALFWPSSRAAIADLAPPEKRTGAYGLWRISNNIGASVGPLLGVYVTQRGLMFGITGLADVAFALVFLALGMESLPAAARAAARVAKDKVALRAQTRREWGQLLTDRAFWLYIVAGIFATVAYQQMYGNYSLYAGTFSLKAYSWVLSLNGALVVFAQAPINHWTRNWSTGKALVLGSLIYAAAYVIFAVPGVWVALGGGVVWTVGEMIIMTAQMTFVADIAPEALRGRYMGASSITWTVGALIAGPFGTQLFKYFGGPTMMLAAAAVTLVGSVIYRRAAVAAHDRLGSKAAPAPAKTNVAEA